MAICRSTTRTTLATWDLAVPEGCLQPVPIALSGKHGQEGQGGKRLLRWQGSQRNQQVGPGGVQKAPNLPFGRPIWALESVGLFVTNAVNPAAGSHFAPGCLADLKNLCVADGESGTEFPRPSFT